MKSEKRNCEIKMELEPKGAGWLYVHMNIGEDNLTFIISSALGDRFAMLLRIMYHLHPNNNDPELEDDICYWNDTCDFEKTDDSHNKPSIIHSTPISAGFCWDEEGSYSQWTIERAPTPDEDFMIKIRIDIHREEELHYCYEVRYKDFCYTIAKACTEVLKKYGIFGYHNSTYEEDIIMRYFLFLKAYALDMLDLIKLTDVESEEYALTSSLENEIKLLLLDM